MARFSDRIVPEIVQVFWAAMARGEFITTAAAEAGTYREKGNRWLREVVIDLFADTTTPVRKAGGSKRNSTRG